MERNGVVVRHSGNFSDYLTLVERCKAAESLHITHDLCSCDLDHAMRFAKEESRHGIRATYLPLHTDAMFRAPKFLDAMRQLRDWGHDIGLHHDAIGVWLGTLQEPTETIPRALDRLRETGPVTFAAAHGAVACYGADGSPRYFNYEVWEEHDDTQNVGAAAGWKFKRASLAELGLTERYFGDQTHYVSDSGGVFRGWSGDPRPRPFERTGGAMIEGLSALDSVDATSRIALLVHPCWWRLP